MYINSTMHTVHTQANGLNYDMWRSAAWRWWRLFLLLFDIKKELVLGNGGNFSDLKWGESMNNAEKRERHEKRKFDSCDGRANFGWGWKQKNMQIRERRKKKKKVESCWKIIFIIDWRAEGWLDDVKGLSTTTRENRRGGKLSIFFLPSSFSVCDDKLETCDEGGWFSLAESMEECWRKKKKLERISLDSICCIEEELNKMKFNIWIFFPMKMDTLGIAKLL